nr:glycosyltransferase family 9 protein [Candidatus Omnitrophota bacterium]
MCGVRQQIAMRCVEGLRFLCNAVLGAVRFILFGPGKRPLQARKVLIFRVSNIGDIMTAVPAMVSIKENFPQATVVLLSSPGERGLPEAQQMLLGVSFLDGIITYYQDEIASFKGLWALVKKLQKERFDLFIDLRQDLITLPALIKDMLFARLIGVKYACGFRIDTVKAFRQIQSECLQSDNEVERLLRILNGEGIRTGAVSYPLVVEDQDKAIVKIFIESLRRDFVVINPHAKRKANRWSIENFAFVGRWLIHEFSCSVVIIGGEQDVASSEKLQALIGNGAVSVASRFTILQTLELLRHARLLLSNDTGAVHMASAVDTPVVGIYSAWQLRGKWYPYGQGHRVVRK